MTSQVVTHVTVELTHVFNVFQAVPGVRLIRGYLHPSVSIVVSLDLT